MLRTISRKTFSQSTNTIFKPSITLFSRTMADSRVEAASQVAGEKKDTSPSVSIGILSVTDLPEYNKLIS